MQTLKQLKKEPNLQGYRIKYKQTRKSSMQPVFNVISTQLTLYTK